ncbi:MAG: fructose-bisphosphate aldolase [archaeon]|jgi:class I fructose-bisphosphate aldolase
MNIKINTLLKKEKALFLAYDQGLEHGPEDFNDKNVDPLSIIKIAKKGDYTGLVFQKGLAEKYRKEIKKSKVPLIVKLNGKTSLVTGEPISRQLCTVKEALKLGAVAVGYTIYIGSQHESEMMQEFEKIEKEAHAKGMPIILWVYPRGKKIKNDISKEMMAYATRTGLELGADIVKIKYGNNKNDLQWAVKAAGRTKVVVAGGIKQSEKDFLKQVKEIMQAGCTGLAVGRNVWQSKNPLELTKKIKKIIWRR